jgi:hypothetical protein
VYPASRSSSPKPSSFRSATARSDLVLWGGIDVCPDSELHPLRCHPAACISRHIGRSLSPGFGALNARESGVHSCVRCSTGAATDAGKPARLALGNEPETASRRRVRRRRTPAAHSASADRRPGGQGSTRAPGGGVG